MNCRHNMALFRDVPKCEGEEQLSQRTDRGAVHWFIHSDGGRSGPEYRDTDFLVSALLHGLVGESALKRKTGKLAEEQEQSTPALGFELRPSSKHSPLRRLCTAR